MTALEEIKSQLAVDMSKGITTVDRLRIIAGGVPDFDPISVEDVEWIISALESLQRENEALKKDRYDLAYAITGGEDAPGLLDSVPTAQLVEIARDTHRSHSADIDRAMAAEAKAKRLQAEIDRKSSMPGDHRYWEGRYRDEAAENEKLREALTPFGTVGAVIDGPFGPALFRENDMAFESGCAWSENGERKTLTWGDFRRARTALASTGGEHHAE